MKAMKTFAALLALAFSLAGCGAVDGDLFKVILSFEEYQEDKKQ